MVKLYSIEEMEMEDLTMYGNIIREHKKTLGISTVEKTIKFIIKEEMLFDIEGRRYIKI